MKMCIQAVLDGTGALRHMNKREKVGFIENTAMRHRWGG